MKPAVTHPGHPGHPGSPQVAMHWRVTHIDRYHRRRRLLVRNVGSRAAALAWVEQLYGHGWYVAAMRDVC